ncbi:hypothetical protein AMAG_04225 [Allomyces macrogynus ATCC 38327]|uniref:Uncharacterized protein n=1 Tax=Allomyces macrogynus (strain ATCC 38327) TaxID=578462 RepID=A0A0L0S7U1_ALLM3|nr:hypothetical protein AMAG_04225 [Allomyces macrogynus ATCC 38327]|eukprot:KNE58668.1 hypothetical protein AMAG_04225 [Allomyces macrogynus ATCC 38327]
MAAPFRLHRRRDAPTAAPSPAAAATRSPRQLPTPRPTLPSAVTPARRAIASRTSLPDLHDSLASDPILDPDDADNDASPASSVTDDSPGAGVRACPLGPPRIAAFPPARPNWHRPAPADNINEHDNDDAGVSFDLDSPPPARIAAAPGRTRTVSETNFPPSPGVHRKRRIAYLLSRPPVLPHTLHVDHHHDADAGYHDDPEDQDAVDHLIWAARNIPAVPPRPVGHVPPISDAPSPINSDATPSSPGFDRPPPPKPQRSSAAPRPPFVPRKAPKQHTPRRVASPSPPPASQESEILDASQFAPSSPGANRADRLLLDAATTPHHHHALYPPDSLNRVESEFELAPMPPSPPPRPSFMRTSAAANRATATKPASGPPLSKNGARLAALLRAKHTQHQVRAHHAHHRAATPHAVPPACTVRAISVRVDRGVRTLHGYLHAHGPPPPNGSDAPYPIAQVPLNARVTCFVRGWPSAAGEDLTPWEALVEIMNRDGRPRGAPVVVGVQEVVGVVPAREEEGGAMVFALGLILEGGQLDVVP